jgi:hypothetical protein
VDDRADAEALVEVGAAEEDEQARTERILPAWPSTAGGAKPGRSVEESSAVASPSASTAGSHPDPRTRATSCRSTPVFSARTAAASAAASAYV